MRGCWLVFLLAKSALGADEKKPEIPQITAITPFDLVRGNTAHLKLRGLKLSNATELRFPDSKPALTGEIKEKKAANTINGLEPKTIGDTQVEVKFEVPRDYAEDQLALALATPDGNTAAVRVRVLGPANFQDEKEPNGGLRQAQTPELGKTLRGAIGGDKDVDVFRFTAAAGQRFSVEIFAARGPSLLDPILTALDSRGHLLVTNDDGATRDPAITVTLPADGACFITVQDAHDRGGEYFDYHLTLKEAP